MDTRYLPETAANVYIFLGPEYRENTNKAWEKISPVVKECLLPMGPATGEFCAREYGCDIMYGWFADGDSRAEKLAEGMNELEGICAKVVDVPQTKVEESNEKIKNLAEKLG